MGFECLNTRVYTSNHSIENRTNTWQPVIIRDTSYSTTSIDSNTFPIEHLTSVGILHFNPNTTFFPSHPKFFFSTIFPNFHSSFFDFRNFSNLSPFAISSHIENVFECMCRASITTYQWFQEIWCVCVCVKIASNYWNGAAIWIADRQTFLQTKQVKRKLKTLWHSCIQLEWEFIEFRLSK